MSKPPTCKQGPQVWVWPQEPRTTRCAGLLENQGHRELRQTLLKLVTLTCSQYLKKENRYKGSRNNLKSTCPLFENYHLTGLSLIKDKMQNSQMLSSC